jgi:4-hydroxy-tetrahydrodipicolinate synthase
MSKFIGTGVAVITPFHENKNIDFDALTGIINHLIDQGIDYLVALGSTAEAATLSYDEKTKVAEHFVKVVAGKVPLVIGIGGNDTAMVVKEIQERDLTGFDAILSVVPAYNKPSQEGMYQHFKKIAEVSELPIILYNVPGRTGKNMESKTIVRLAQNYDNIIAVKEAAGDIVQAMELISTTPQDFQVISGDDDLALPMVLAGGAGVISVIAQGMPKEFSTMINLGLQGKNQEAYKIQYRVMPCIKLIFAEGNPTGIKNMMSQQDLCKDVLRLPLIPASKTLAREITAFVS